MAGVCCSSCKVHSLVSILVAHSLDLFVGMDDVWNFCIHGGGCLKSYPSAVFVANLWFFQSVGLRVCATPSVCVCVCVCVHVCVIH